MRRIVQFAVTLADERIVVSLIRQLSWTHFIALIPLKDLLQRDYCAQMASAECWSLRTLRERIDSMLYERTAIRRAASPETIVATRLGRGQVALSETLATAFPPIVIALLPETTEPPPDVRSPTRSTAWT